ncbi:immunity 9 family protein [Hymenobacter sp. 15J16-1T3B]|uniref:Imm9 family immunity protein n=1 Tax=Hymenobacter sp. 15J16-1T3B TaxID=2886941 RepID=UPI001D100B88|nr:Imm9 family immunity protein [Hymenobacter sp. 15J16-1T3B]MCC3157984.1 immunity 9 family protein [Hymenobacter sp. 15J16-1T3B]
MDIDFNSDEISRILKKEADNILNLIDIPSLSDWELQFKATYGSNPPLRVFMRTRSYTNDKQKLIVIHIPIPKQDIVAWGVTPKQQVKLKTHPDEARYCSYLDVNFAGFSNRTDYILDSMRRGIMLCFEKGFTVNGVKIKLK